MESIRKPFRAPASGAGSQGGRLRATARMEEEERAARAFDAGAGNDAEPRHLLSG
jgi:hypothetical protein